MSACLSLIPLLLAVAGCPGEPERPPRVALIGIDGASLDVVERLAREGRLPNLDRLMRTGAFGVLGSLTPTKSPPLWTSIATGRLPAEHGIVDFRVPVPGYEEPQLVNATTRRVPALWNIASRYERTVGFVGWWATWPAERVRGFIVSDHVAYTRHHARERPGFVAGFGNTWPDSIEEEVQGLVRLPGAIDVRELEALVEFTPEERNGVLGRSPIMGDAFRLLSFSWQRDRSYRDITLRLVETRGQPDLLGVLFRGTDTIGHLFWHTFEPEKARSADPDQTRRLGPLLPGYYARIDGFVGDLLSELDPGTDVLVVSDHGMESTGGSDPSIHPRPGEHTLDGIYILSGPRIRGVGRSGRRSLLGVTPTVLRLLGLPLAEDMPEAPFEDLLDVPGRTGTVPSHGPPTDPAVRASSSIERSILKQLEALGYLESQ